MAQDSLPGLEPKRRRPSAGPTERGLATALRAARAAGQLQDQDAALELLARTLARQLDVAEAAARDSGKPSYAAPQLARELRDTVQALGLIRPAGSGDDDGLASFGVAEIPHGA